MKRFGTGGEVVNFNIRTCDVTILNFDFFIVKIRIYPCLPSSRVKVCRSEINYPNKRPNKLPESSDRIEFTRITRPNNNYPNKGPNNLPEYKPNENQKFGPDSGKVFGQDSGNK
jgi:hypothetical protein